jgi:hypothetical protein
VVEQEQQRLEAGVGELAGAVGEHGRGVGNVSVEPHGVEGEDGVEEGEG